VRGVAGNGRTAEAEIADKGGIAARLLAGFCALLVGAAATSSLAAAPAAPSAGSGATSVIVRAESGMLTQLEHSTVLAGGTVVRELGLINGFAAKIPTTRLAAMRALPGVVAVSPNSAVDLHSEYNPGTDPHSMASTAGLVGASAAWAAGITGSGVDVALVDSGVSPVQGLAGEGKVVNGPDLSVDSQTASTQYLDGFGHGTFMAGLIAARDPGADPAHPGGSYFGIAPDARIVNVKVGSGSGAVDVSQVIAGIDWVVAHRHDNGLNIRVLNLSIGTNSNQSYQLDPLAYAAEVAWRSGIVVVAAAGNSGAATGHLDDPASDPFVIAVGASASNGGGLLGGLLSSLLVAAFSSLGNGTRNPDLIAPGSHLQGLRVPGSYIDQHFPSAAFGDRYFRGSGTSEAAALTSGAVALLLQKRPWLQPGQVKAILTQTAAALPLLPVRAQGAGLLQLRAGVSDALSVPGGGQGFSPASGNGSLEKARGDNHVSLNGVPLTGEEDIFGHGFSAEDHAAQSAGGQGWSDGGWNGTTWSGTTWSGTTWSGTTWSGTTWSGTTWSGTTWSGTTWTGTTWSGTTWSGTTWSGTTWSGEIWSSYSWS
jgi:serine protease AprX